MSDAYDWEQADKAMQAELDRMNRTTNIITEVAAERRRQVQLWGEQNHPLGMGGPIREKVAEVLRNYADAMAKQGTLTWSDILAEEVAEAEAESDLQAARKELIQVAAVAVAIIDWIDRGAPNAE